MTTAGMLVAAELQDGGAEAAEAAEAEDPEGGGGGGGWRRQPWRAEAVLAAKAVAVAESFFAGPSAEPGLHGSLGIKFNEAAFLEADESTRRIDYIIIKRYSPFFSSILHVIF